MIVFKNHNDGFSFIEIVTAIFIMGLMVSALLTLSQSSMRSLSTYSQRLEKIFILKKTLFDITFAQLNQKTPEPAEQTTGTKISYREIPITDGSSLKQFKDTISCYQVKGEWSAQGVPLQEVLVIFKLKDAGQKKS